MDTATGDGLTTDFQLTNSPIYDSANLKAYIDGNLEAGLTLDADAGLVIFAAPPANLSKVEIKYKFSLLSDADITEILGQYDAVTDDGAPKLAAADCLDIIATSEALIQKRIKMLDLSTDGPAVADSLRKHAQTLREQVYKEPSYDIAEQVLDEAGFVEKLTKDWWRGL